MLSILRKFLENDFAAGAALICAKKELWYDLRTVYPDMGGNNRELGVMIQLCQDSDKIPTSADKTMMRLSMLNSYGSMSRDQKV